MFLESTKEKVCIKYATSLRGVCQLACTHDHVMYTYQLVVMIFTCMSMLILSMNAIKPKHLAIDSFC